MDGENYGSENSHIFFGQNAQDRKDEKRRSQMEQDIEEPEIAWSEPSKFKSSKKDYSLSPAETESECRFPVADIGIFHYGRNVIRNKSVSQRIIVSYQNKK
jgi:hypothetical protein